MPAASAWRIRSSWHSFQAGVCIGLMAPVRSVSLSSGNHQAPVHPDHAAEAAAGSQAPTAELNENSEGMGSL
jgi:hypothetical protein